MMTSEHYDKHRNKRQRVIDNYTNGDGNVIETFVINKGHRKGAEIHKITDTGLIIIYNRKTTKLITKLIARPNQIRRYYESVDKTPPRWLISLAEWHENLGYNK